MLASLYSDRERAIKRCNIRRFPINTGTHTETDIPLTFYTHLLTSLTSMTLPNVPSPRVETTSSERVKVQQLQSNISYQITTKFNIQHHPPLLLILVVLFWENWLQRGFILSEYCWFYLWFSCWILNSSILMKIHNTFIQFPAEANFFFFKMQGFASISIFFNSFNMELKETPKILGSIPQEKT